MRARWIPTRGDRGITGVKVPVGGIVPNRGVLVGTLSAILCTSVGCNMQIIKILFKAYRRGLYLADKSKSTC